MTFLIYLIYVNKKKITKESKFEDVVLTKIPDEWEKFDTIVGEHMFINNLKLSNTWITNHIRI